MLSVNRNCRYRALDRNRATLKVYGVPFQPQHLATAKAVKGGDQYGKLQP